MRPITIQTGSRTAAFVQQPCSNPADINTQEKHHTDNMVICRYFASFRKVRKSMVPPLHGGGQGFESPRLHSENLLFSREKRKTEKEGRIRRVVFWQ